MDISNGAKQWSVDRPHPWMKGLWVSSFQTCTLHFIFPHLEARIRLLVVHWFWEIQVFLLFSTCWENSMVQPLWFCDPVLRFNPHFFKSLDLLFCKTPITLRTAHGILCLVYPPPPPILSFEIFSSLTALNHFALNHNMSGWGWWVYRKVLILPSMILSILEIHWSGSKKIS